MDLLKSYDTITTTTTNNNNNNNKNTNDNNNNDNLYLKRVTQSNGKDLPWGPRPTCKHAQGYKVVEYIAYRFRDLKEGRNGAHLIGLEYEMHFWPMIYYILEELTMRLHIEYHSCDFLV